MSIRVGRCTYTEQGRRIDPSCDLPEGKYKPIVVLTKSSTYGSLGPYVLKNDKGQIMENIWQFSKIYQRVPASTQHYSRYDKTIIWKYPATNFVTPTGTLTVEYLDWRSRGYNNPHAVRYPLGHRYQVTSKEQINA